MTISFRKCEFSDLALLLEIAKKTFVDAFEKDNNPDDFNTYIRSAFSEKQFKKELTDVNSHFYVAYVEGALVGYFKLNEHQAQNEQFEDSSIELERIYILNTFQKQGFGRLLLFKAIEIARTKKVSFLWLGVWEENKAAIRFYERYGFERFDMHPYYIGRDKQLDWLLKFILD